MTIRDAQNIRIFHQFVITQFLNIGGGSALHRPIAAQHDLIAIAN
jgi:hypothetical protein